jgi:PAS domain S-box-containing protein
MAERIRILSIDDESALLDMGKLFLERRGEFAVDTAISAAEALAILENQNYDAIVSDYQMPEMDGIELLKKVRATQKNVPFIIFTGRGREEIVIEALNNGADFYLQKGGDPKTLYTELGHVIQQSVLMRRTLMSLTEQEQRYHDLQNANDLIQSVSPDGHFLFVNKKWLDTLGYQEDDLPSLTIFDIIHEESIQHCMTTFQRVIAGENVGIVDAVFKKRDGTRVYVEGMADCKIVEGQPQYTRGLFKDVTDRKLTEAALKESEARYRNVVEDQTELISRFRPDGTHVFVNDAYCRYFHKTRDEIIGRRFIPLIPEEDRALVAQHLSSLTPEHPVATLSNRIIRKDGQVRWQQWSNRAIFDENGRVREYQSVGRDITDLKEAEQELLKKNEEINAAFEELTATEEELRKNYDLISQKEQALRESGDVFRAMVEQSGEGIIIVDFLGMLQFANSRAWDIIQYPPDKRATGSFNVLEIVSSESRVDAVRDLLQVSKGIDSFPVNYKIITFEKTEIWIECIGKKISYKGSPAMLLSFRDITERRTKQRTVEENEKKFRTIFENNPYPICINSIPDGKFIAVNAAFLQSSGYAEAEVLGKSPVEMGMLSLIDFGRLSSRLLVSGRIENMPMVFTGKGGVRVNVQFSVIPVTISDRPAILTMTVEITTMKQVEEELHQKNQDLAGACERLTVSEEELRENYDQLAALQKTVQESEARFRTLFAISPEGIILFDIAGRITFASPEALRMFRVSSMDEAIGTSVFDWVEPEYHERVQEAMGQLLDGTFQSATTYKVRRRDTSSFFAETSQGIFPDANGHPDGFMIIIRDITDRLQAETALRESEENFRKIFENSAIGMILSLPDFRFQLVNPAWVSMMGYTEEEFRKISFKEITHPDDLAGDIENIRALDAGTIPVYSTEKRYIRKDGSILWGAIKVTTIRNQDGTLRNYLAQIEDITLRKRAEELVRESEKKFAIVFKSNPVSLTLVSAMDGRFVDANDAFVAITGYSREEVVGRTSGELGLFPYPLEYEQLISRLRSTHRVEGMELQVRKKTGEVGTCRFSCGVILMGDRPYILSTVEDITERKQAEEELRESEERFRMLLQHVPSVAVQGYGMDGTTQYWNEASERLYGYPAEEAVGKNLVDLIIPPEMKDDVRNAIAYMAESGQPIPASELSLMKKDGSRVAVFSSHAIVKRPGGKPELFCIDIDLTGSRQAEEALRQANKKLNLLSGITRHDITNKLMTLNGFVELLNQKIPDPAYEDYFSRIMKASSQINAMINFTREYEKIGVSAPVWQDLQELVNRAAEGITLGPVTLKNDLPARAEMFADPLIFKVFFNLIDNAVRYGGTITTIRFSLESGKDDPIIVCEDDGGGVGTDEKEKIFKRGYGKNTGFGLALSREILDITGITIQETGKPGEGARFEISVPRAQFRPAPQ